MSRLVALVVLALLVLAPGTVLAQKFRGLGFSTPYPGQTVRAGEVVALPVTVHNYDLPPQVVTLRVVQVAPGWRARFIANGRPVLTVYVAPDQDASVTLRLEPPRTAASGTFRFRFAAEGGSARAELPVTLVVGEVLPGRLELDAELPVLRGPSTSTFRYRLTLRNDSGQDLLANLGAETQKRFQVTFTPSPGDQQVTSVPIKAGESRDIDTEVTMPKETPAGRYPITVSARVADARAEVKLTAEVTGRPDLSITTPDNRLSGRAYAGRDTPVKLVVKNSGSAPARNVELSSSPPSGWDVTFEPRQIAEIPVNGQQEVTARIKPSPKALAGDYMLTLTASASDTSNSADFRITVLTSTLWGIVGIVVIVAAVGVLSVAVSRYGRR